MVNYLRISSYVTKPFLIYDFVTAPFWISLCMRKILISFLSVLPLGRGDVSDGVEDNPWRPRAARGGPGPSLGQPKETVALG